MVDRCDVVVAPVFGWRGSNAPTEKHPDNACNRLAAGESHGNIRRASHIETSIDSSVIISGSSHGYWLVAPGDSVARERPCWSDAAATGIVAGSRIGPYSSSRLSGES